MAAMGCLLCVNAHAAQQLWSRYSAPSPDAKAVARACLSQVTVSVDSAHNILNKRIKNAGVFRASAKS
jgi:hypothetical protein